MFLHVTQVDEFEGQDVRGLEMNGRGESRLEDLLPSFSAQAPAVTGSHPGEANFGMGSRQVIAAGTAELEEFRRGFDTDKVMPEIVTASNAATGTVETGQGVAAAFFYFGSEHIQGEEAHGWGNPVFGGRS